MGGRCCAAAGAACLLMASAMRPGMQRAGGFAVRHWKCAALHLLKGWVGGRGQQAHVLPALPTLFFPMVSDVCHQPFPFPILTASCVCHTNRNPTHSTPPIRIGSTVGAAVCHCLSPCWVNTRLCVLFQHPATRPCVRRCRQQPTFDESAPKGLTNTEPPRISPNRTHLGAGWHMPAQPSAWHEVDSQPPKNCHMK